MEDLNYGETQQLIDAVDKYTKELGKCSMAYKHMRTCLSDACSYCSMIRAYIKLTDSAKGRPRRRADDRLY